MLSKGENKNSYLLEDSHSLKLSSRNINVKIGIPACNLSNNIETIIVEKAKNLVLKREMNNIGLIFEIEKVKNIYGGEIIDGISHFTVMIYVKIYMPKLNEKIKTRVKNVSIHGYYVDEPIEIFVGTDKKPTIKEGDTVSIKITKIGFNNGHFVVIAKEIN